MKVIPLLLPASPDPPDTDARFHDPAPVPVQSMKSVLEITGLFAIWNVLLLPVVADCTNKRCVVLLAPLKVKVPDTIVVPVSGVSHHAPAPDPVRVMFVQVRAALS